MAVMQRNLTFNGNAVQWGAEPEFDRSCMGKFEDLW
jgi:hypothetical protein